VWRRGTKERIRAHPTLVAIVKHRKKVPTHSTAAAASSETGARALDGCRSDSTSGILVAVRLFEKTSTTI